MRVENSIYCLLFLKQHKLIKNPFTATINSFIIKQEEREQIIELIEAIQNDMWKAYMIIGESNTGKSTLAKMLEQVAKKEFGIEVKWFDQFPTLFKHFLESIEPLDQNKKTLIILDNCERMDSKQLDKVKAWTDREKNGELLSPVIMIAEPVLEKRLAKYYQKGLYHGLVNRTKLIRTANFTQQDTLDYITKNQAQHIYQDLEETAKTIHQITQGNPRRTQRILSTTIYEAGKKNIKGKIPIQIVRETSQRV